VLVGVTTDIYSQRSCGWAIAIQKIENNPIAKSRRVQIEKEINRDLARNVDNRTELFRIPVVVHIVMSNPHSISDERVNSQIDVLNQDFSATNSDLENVPEVFKEYIGNSHFEFYLAPEGSDCNGIIRRTSNVECFTEEGGTADDIKRTIDGGSDPIDPEHILNIWVGNLCGADRGYTQPLGGNILTDGIVIDYAFFGLNSGSTNYDLGRTTTHEVGHYFNLQHIWGADDCTSSCNDSDGIDDTPNQDDCNQGCPTFPHFSCSDSQNGDMFMNFMDYVYDDCMHMFTEGQAAKMRCVLSTARIGLLEYVSIPEVDITITKLPTCLEDNAEVTAIVDCGGVPPYTFLWSNGETTQTISDLGAGTYTVTVTDANGQSTEASVVIEEEIIVPYGTTWSEVSWEKVIEEYDLDPNELKNRSVYVHSHVGIDVDYTFTNVTFSFNDEEFYHGKFAIKSDIEVAFYGNDGTDKSKLQGCGGEWGGITLYNSSTLTIHDAKILDAFIGIFNSHGEFHANDIVIRGFGLNESNFLQNGIYAQGNSECDLSNYDISNYYAGIRLLSNSTYPIFIGGKMENVKMGMILVGTPAMVIDQDISPTAKSLFIYKGSGSVIGLCKMNSGRIGLESEFSKNLSIYKNEINNVKEAIRLRECSNSEIINNWNIGASEYGVRTYGSNELIVRDNIIGINGSSQNRSAAVQLISDKASIVSNNSISVDNSSYGIETIGCSDDNIINNIISYTTQSQNPNHDRIAAIHTIGSTWELFKKNTINGVPNVNAMASQNSNSNTYECNEIYGLPDFGFYVGDNSEFQDMLGNKFHDCSTDLMIRSRVGPQWHHGNEFHNGYCYATALNDSELENSYFYVNSTYTDHMPAFPNPGNEKWFIDETNVVDEDHCGGEGGEKMVFNQYCPK